jgi:hypothetical protein
METKNSEDIVERILLEEFEKCLDSSYEQHWFMGPRPFLTIKEEKAIKIVEKCNQSTNLREISTKAYEFSKGKYEEILKQNIRCLRKYLSGKNPEPPLNVEFDKSYSDYGSELWIKFNLSYYMEYLRKLENIFRTVGWEVIISTYRKDILSEHGTYKSVLAVIRKLTGNPENFGTDINYTFHRGVGDIVKHFCIPNELLREEADKFKILYEKIIE